MRTLATFRYIWNIKTTDKVRPISTKLSVKLGLEPRDIWVGLYWTKRDEDGSRFWYVCPLPCVVIRLHHKESWGGQFPTWRGRPFMFSLA